MGRKGARIRLRSYFKWGVTFLTKGVRGDGLKDFDFRKALITQGCQLITTQSLMLYSATLNENTNKQD